MDRGQEVRVRSTSVLPRSEQGASLTHESQGWVALGLHLAVALTRIALPSPQFTGTSVPSSVPTRHHPGRSIPAPGCVAGVALTVAFARVLDYRTDASVVLTEVGIVTSSVWLGCASQRRCSLEDRLRHDHPAVA